MSQSNYHRLNDLLVHSCNRVLRALLAAVIKRESPSGARTIDELIQRDRGNIATRRIVKQNIHLVLTWNNIVILDRWDLQLLCFFIRYVCPPNDVVHKDIEALKEIRNKICHTPDGLIDDFYYRAKSDEIKLINSRFLAIIGNAAFREAVEEEIEEIDNGIRNIPEAVDTLREWLGRDKLQRTPITSFSDEQQEILDCLRRALGRREFAHLHVPDAEVDIVVENADNIHQQDQVSETLVNILDPGLRSDPQLCNLTEAQFTAIKDKVHECFDYLLESGQVVVRATHGCVIITVRSNSFESLGNVWRKLVSAETEVIMAPLQEVLRKTFSERLTIKAVLPECAFLDVAEQLAQQIKDIDQDGSKEGHESRAQIPEIEKGMEKLSVQEKPLTDPISVINLKIKPKSLKDYERLHRKLSKGKMDTAFERITDVLQQELNAPKLIISANLRSSGLSAKPKELDVAFTCFNGTRLQLIREDVGTLVKEAIVVETTESFDFESSEMGKALLEACGEQIVKQCHEKYPRGLQPGEIANIKGQKLLGGTQILLTCLPEYSEDMIHIMKQTFHKCLVTAVHHKMYSIAFTAVGTSNAKYPVDVVASALTETCISFDKEKKLGSIQDIAFVVPPADESGYLAFKKELQRPGIFELKPLGSKEKKPKQEFATRKQQQESLWKYPSKEFDPKKELEDTPYSEEKYQSRRRKSFIVWNQFQGDDEIRMDLIGGDLENIKIDHMGHGIVVACSTSLNLIAGRSTESLLKAGGQGLQIQCNKKYPKGIKYGEVAEIDGENQLKNVRIYLVALARWSHDEEQENERILEDVVLKCLDNADDAELRTLTFTPLGCGQMRWPKKIFVECLINVLVKKGTLFSLEFIQVLVFYKDESTFRDLELNLLQVPHVVPVKEEIQDEPQGEIFHVDPQKDFLEDATRIISAAKGRIKVFMQDDGNGRAPNTRQFFKEFFTCVTSSKSGMFSSSGKGINYIPVKNEDAEIKEMFFTVGKAIGLAWLSVRKVELPLAAYVVVYIHGQPYYGDSLNLGAVHDTALVQFLQKVNTCAHQAELDDILAKDNEGYLRKYGVASGRKIDLSEIAEVCRELLISYLIDHRKDALEQMRIGVSSLNIHSFVKSMIHKSDVSISVVWDLFKTKVDELSMADEAEERVKMMMKSYVQSIEDDDDVLKLLKYSVGNLSYYEGDLHICICYNTINRKETLPISIPYVQVLKLPLGNETFEEFTQSFNDALKWHLPSLNYYYMSFDRK